MSVDIKGKTIHDNVVIGDGRLDRRSFFKVRDRLGIIVTLECLDGRKVELVVREGDGLVDVVRKIQNILRFEVDEHRLLIQGRILEDYGRLRDYNIKDNKYIKVVPVPKDEVRIIAKLIGGDTRTIHVLRNNRISKVKEKIGVIIGVSLEKLTLSYQGRILEDERSMAYYDIVDYSIVEVNGYEFDVAIRYTGRIYAIRVTLLTTVRDLKVEFNKRAGFNNLDYHLLFNNVKLEDDTTVTYYNIEYGGCIQCIQCVKGGGYGFVSVNIDGGESLCISVCGQDMTILDVKKEIEAKTGLSPVEQILRHNGTILEDGYRIMDYHGNTLSDGVTMETRPGSFQISVMTEEGPPHLIDIKVIDKIIELRRKIQEKIALSPEEQILKLRVKIIRDDTLTVFKAGIITKSVIVVSKLCRINIIILSENMETVPLEILNSDGIIDVKKKIENKIGIPYNDQILEYKNAQMKDDMTVDEFCIADMSGLMISEIRGRGVCVIINNERFTDPNKWTERPGTNQDEENIYDTFEQMGYIIKVHRNVSKENMDKVISDTKDNVEGGHNTMVVFILSHGDENGVVTYDSHVIPHKEIWSPFMNDKFPKFSGKNKFFFFSCCQGPNINKPVDAASTSEVQYDGPGSKCPTMADIFIGYATSHSYHSVRHSKNGTFYIKCLCEIIRKHRRWSINDIHTEVQKELSRQPIEGTNEYQMPCFLNHLRDHAYFIDSIFL